MDKPTLFFDGNCGFCRRFIERWRHKTKNRIDYAPFEETAPESVVFIEPNGKKYTGAEAVFRAKAWGTKFSLGLWAYQKIPKFSKISETVYRWVARHRKLLSKFFPGQIKG